MTRVAIVGGGPGGYEAALVAAQLGAEVTLVDSDGIGGSAVLTDCVPSKALISTAAYVGRVGQAAQMGVRPVEFPPDTLARLGRYAWPGNVRELLALLERYCVLNDSKAENAPLLEELLVEQQKLMLRSAGKSLPTGALAANVDARPGYSLKKDLDRIRREVIRKSIEHCGGDKQRAAKELGMSYTTLWRELREDEEGGAEAAPEKKGRKGGA